MNPNPNNVNQTAMLAVADVIEWADRLNMNTFGLHANFIDTATPAEVWEDCGTVACIAGWTCAWADREEAASSLVAKEELGLTLSQANRLFYGDYDFWDAHNLNTDSKVAADVLRKIARGEIEL